MPIFIPNNLQQQIRHLGPKGSEWLDALPHRIAELEVAWDLRVGDALDHHGVASWVAQALRSNGTEAILKIGIPDDDARYESHALRLAAGRSAVHLLEVTDDGFSLLLERCVPGADLWTLPEEEADAFACRLLLGFWQTPLPDAPFPRLSDVADAWWRDLPGITSRAAYDAAMVDLAVARGRELAASQPRETLLHGDFHPANVLAAQRQP